MKTCATHEWHLSESPTSAIDQWECAACTATSATCIVTHHDETHPVGSSLPICEQCLRRERKILSDIERFLGHWDRRDYKPQKSSMAYPLVRVHGGKPDSDEQRTPEDVLDVMWSWVGLWTERTGAEKSGWKDFLQGHLMWAANNPEDSGWEDFTREIRQQRAAARSLVGLDPLRLPEPCMYCGGRVVQDWADKHGEPYPDGLQDAVRCTRCDLAWSDRSEFQRVVREHVQRLPETAPDARVTLDLAKRVKPGIPSATWRSWIHRGELVVDEAGTVALRDVQVLATRRSQELRSRKRAG